MAIAQDNLAFMYQKGLGVTQDYTEAVNWYRKAAEQGNAQGQANLGDMYELVKESTRTTPRLSTGTERLLNKAILRPEQPGPYVPGW